MLHSPFKLLWVLSASGLRDVLQSCSPTPLCNLPLQLFSFKFLMPPGYPLISPSVSSFLPKFQIWVCIFGLTPTASCLSFLTTLRTSI